MQGNISGWRPIYKAIRTRTRTKAKIGEHEIIKWETKRWSGVRITSGRPRNKTVGCGGVRYKINTTSPLTDSGTIPSGAHFAVFYFCGTDFTRAECFYRIKGVFSNGLIETGRAVKLAEVYGAPKIWFLEVAIKFRNGLIQITVWCYKIYNFMVQIDDVKRFFLRLPLLNITGQLFFNSN